MRPFTMRFRGYHPRQVDDMAARVEEALAGADESVIREVRDDLAEAEFEITMRGYARDEVGAAVREWIERLDSRL